MDHWRGRVALITGITGDIGKATAKLLLENGMKVIGCAENQEALKEVERELKQLGEVKMVVCDVTEEDQIYNMFREIKTSYKRIDICINNANITKKSNILDGNPGDWQKVFDVNVIGLLRVTTEAISLMKSRNCSEGHVINIGSICGHKVQREKLGSGVAVYCASEFAVTALTEGLRKELADERPHFCKVTLISPAMVETQMTKELKTGIEMLKAEDVAQTVIHLLSLPSHIQVDDIILRAVKTSSA